VEFVARQLVSFSSTEAKPCWSKI